MSAVITPADVKATAALARLGLSDKELQQATQDLSNILGHFSSLQAIDTSTIKNNSDVTGLTNISRADEVQTDTLATSTNLLFNAPDTLDGHLKVPAVF